MKVQFFMKEKKRFYDTAVYLDSLLIQELLFMSFHSRRILIFDLEEELRHTFLKLKVEYLYE
ncbi:MAG: hypothetical protein GVX96_06055 [Bacteroidetes bacterium]|jgi:hypothetical protein|nr:hypothetical protein [Bacteroidota bacterium]